MKTLALATYSAYPVLPEDDQSLIQPLADQGIHARPAVWDGPDFDWQSVDGVVIRSCWDYHLKLDQFVEWIASLKRLGIRVWNAPETLFWNSNKVYLRDLERKGVAVIPTLWPERGFRLKDRLLETGWQAAVIKPRVSATAYRTCVISAEGAGEAQPQLDELIENPGAMVQQFIPGIRTRGEWSLSFFAGRFSHAVIKTPKAGDFRVQAEHGGSERRVPPPDFVLAAAKRALAALAEVPLYARVDGVENDGQFLLMELELIEPTLYLTHDPEAPARFADAIAGAMRKLPSR